MNMKAVAASLPRRDGRDKVTGPAPYIANMDLPGMLHCTVLRSPLPHARILRIDKARAEALPGVVTVLTGADLAGDPGISPYYGPAVTDQPILAIDRVRFVGEPVAAVAAETLDIAGQAVDLIEVEYEELPPVTSAEEALAEGAPVLHEQVSRPAQAMGDLAKTTRPIHGTNIVNHFHVRRGDAEAALREADGVVEGVYRMPNVQHAPMEPHGALALWDRGGKLTVWSCTQTPYVVRQQLAAIFRRPQSQVRVIVPYIGGGYGSKTYPKLEPLVAAVARQAGRPVKWVLTREEEFLTVTRHAVTVRMKTGFRKDGTITARKVEIYWDTGAYADIGPRLIKNGGYAANGPYKCPNVWVDSYCVYTNKPPSVAFRGYGVSKVAFAYETQMDEIAALLGRDPLDLRLQNLIRDGDTFATGEEMKHTTFVKTLETAVRAVGWEPVAGPPSEPPAQGKVRGKGMAVVVKGTVTPSTSAAACKINEDGSLNVLISTVEMGQGAETVLAQMAAEELGLPVEQVSVVLPDTDVTPFDLTTSSSRSTFSMGNALLLAVRDAKRQLLEAAAPLLGVDQADLEVLDGRVRISGNPDRSLTIGEVMRSPGGVKFGTILGQGHFATEGGLDPDTGQGIASAFWSAAAACCEVEVDAETGVVRILNYSSAVHAGTPINPALCLGQSEGSVVMGTGVALMEELKFTGGQPVNASFLDYHIPSTLDIPDRLSPHLVTDAFETGPFGAKGMGEQDLPSVAPAVANAIFHACGIHLKELPFTPEKVLGMIKARRKGG